MKIRLMGTREECLLYVNAFDPDLVLDVSGFYPNRGNSKLGRVYLEVRELAEINTLCVPLIGGK